MKKTKRSYNSTLSPVAFKRKPKPRPTLAELKAKGIVKKASSLGKKPMRKRARQDIEWGEIFSYCKDTGSLFWKDLPWAAFNIKAKFIGKEAGTYILKDATGSRDSIRVSINGSSYPAHQIIWWLHGKIIPMGCVIDHVNRDPWDNRLENLRIATKHENAINAKRLARNTSGSTGVHFCNTTNRWVAKMRKYGKTIHIGAFKTKEEAVTAKNEKALEIYGDFNPVKKKPLRPRSRSYVTWIDVAEEIWNERKHVCEVCKVYIANPSPANFSHLLPRSTYPELKRDKRNIRIKCQKCHDLWHKHGPDALQWSTGWTKVCTLYFELYREAHGIK